MCRASCYRNFVVVHSAADIETDLGYEQWALQILELSRLKILQACKLSTSGYTASTQTEHWYGEHLSAEGSVV